MNSSLEDSSLILYQTEDGQTRVEVSLLDETVWLTQAQMAELFSKDKRTISEHIQNIFKEGELPTDSTVRNFWIVQKEGTREVSRLVDHYNLDDFLKVATPREILSHSGKVSHKAALDKARNEYQKYQEQLKNNQLSLVEKHFFQVTHEIEQMKPEF